MATSSARCFGHIALALVDLDATLIALRDQGIEPEREPYRVREGGSRIWFVQDPDGNNVEAVFHTPVPTVQTHR